MIFSPALVLRRCNWLTLRVQHVCCVATHLHRLHAEAFRVQEPDRERAAAEDLRPALFQQPAYLFDIKGGIPGLPCLSIVKMVTGLTSFLLQWSLKNGLRLPQPRTIRGAYCLSPAGPAPQGAVPPRQCYPAVLYPPHTSPNPAGMFNAAAQCGGRVEYPPVPVRTVHTPHKVRLPGIFAGNVALLTGLRLINRAYRKGAAPPASPIHS